MVVKKYRRENNMRLENRPLTRLIQKGVGALSDPELLTIILGKDVDKGKYKTAFELAHEIFQKYDIRDLSKASLGELDQMSGIGKVRAAQIQAVFELGRRLTSYSEDINPTIETSKDVYNLLGESMKNLNYEMVKVILLNAQNRVIRIKDAFKGTLDSSITHPREILKYAIQNSASSIILVHNHPSGDPTPSPNDIVVTSKIIKAGELVGIEVRDHIIIGGNNHASLIEGDYIKT